MGVETRVLGLEGGGKNERCEAGMRRSVGPVERVPFAMGCWSDEEDACGFEIELDFECGCPCIEEIE